MRTKSGKIYPADIVILALGVRPDTALAKSAGLQIGERGGIRVDEQMRTSDPDIFAVGDAVEVRDFVTGEWSLVALAGPANRQGRIAADVIAGRDSRFRGTQGTAIIGLFGGAAAWTGVSEKTLTKRGDNDYEKVYLFPNSHAGYYPGAKPHRAEGHLPQVGWTRARRAGARRGCAGRRQAHQRDRGRDPDGRDDLRPRGSGALLRAAVRQREGRGQLRRHGRRRRAATATCRSRTGRSADGAFLLDVRQPLELVVEGVPGAVNIPLPQLRARLGELPRDREILTICRSGGRAYFATRILLQNGFKARVRFRRHAVAHVLSCLPSLHGTRCQRRNTSVTEAHPTSGTRHSMATAEEATCNAHAIEPHD